MSYKISVIIPTLNEEKNIANILGDLFTQTKLPFEVFVVDGSSKDTTALKVAKFKNAKLIKTKAQPAHQRHLGALKSKGEILVFLDADTRIKPNFLNNINNIFSKSDMSYACPFYIPIKLHIPSLILYTFFNTIFFLVQKLMPCGAGACIIIKRKIYLKSGGFDEKYVFDDMQLLSKTKNFGKFSFIKERVFVSDRRIKKMGFLNSFTLYLKLSWYFIRNDYSGANKVKYPFAMYNK